MHFSVGYRMGTFCELTCHRYNYWNVC